MPITFKFLIVAITKNRRFFRDYSLTFNLAYDFIIYIAIHLNSAIDPLIYGYRIKKVRDAIKKFFTLKNSLQVSSQSS